MRDSGNEPQRLGGVKLLNCRSGWQLWYEGQLRCERLTTPQVCQLIRGEQTLAGLVAAGDGSDGKAEPATGDGDG
jgi:hypothetical protein